MRKLVKTFPKSWVEACIYWLWGLMFFTLLIIIKMPIVEAKTCNLHKSSVSTSGTLYLVCTEGNPLVPHASWTSYQFSSTYSSNIGPSLATDGKRWCGMYKEFSTNNMTFMCNDSYSNTTTNNWTRVPLSHQTGHTPSLATDGKKWCSMVIAPTNSRTMWIVCNSGNLNLASDWHSTPLNGFSSGHAPSLATDGKRWCSLVKSNSGTTDLIIVCTEGDPMVASGWRSVNLAPLSTSDSPSLATDGKRWCSMGKAHNSETMWIHCAKGDPLKKDNWTSVSLSPFATSVGPSLATDGRIWCSSVKGSGVSIDIFNVCTSGENPMSASSWQAVNLTPFMTSHYNAISPPKVCKYAGEEAALETECCSGLKLISRKCQAHALPVNNSSAALKESGSEGCNGQVNRLDMNRLRRETGRKLGVFENLYSNMDATKFKSPFGHIEKLIEAAKLMKSQNIASENIFKLEKEKLLKASSILARTTTTDAAAKTVAEREFTVLMGYLPSEPQVEMRNIQKRMILNLKTFLSSLMTTSMAVDEKMEAAKKLAANEEWLCKKTTLLNCGLRRWIKKEDNAPDTDLSHPYYYIDPIYPTEYLNPSTEEGSTFVGTKLTALRTLLTTNVKFKTYKGPIMTLLDGADAKIENAGELTYDYIVANSYYDVKGLLALAAVDESSTGTLSYSFNKKTSTILALQTENAFLINYYDKSIAIINRRLSADCAEGKGHGGEGNALGALQDETLKDTFGFGDNREKAKVETIIGKDTATQTTHNSKGGEIAIGNTMGALPGGTSNEGGNSNTHSTVTEGTASSGFGDSGTQSAFNNTLAERSQQFQEMTKDKESQAIVSALKNDHQGFLSTFMKDGNQAASAIMRGPGDVLNTNSAVAVTSNGQGQSGDHGMGGLGSTEVNSPSINGEGNAGNEAMNAQNSREKKDAYGNNGNMNSPGGGYSNYSGSGGSRGSSSGSYGNNPAGNAPAENSLQSALSSSEKEVILRSLNPNRYKNDDDDTIFSRVTKVYYRIALPRLLK